MDKLIIIISAVVGALGVVLLWLLIRAGYIKEVKGVLLYFVTQAEKDFGGKTGKLKKSAVLVWIYEKMPKLIRLFISSEQFGSLIDTAADELTKYLASNTAAAAIVNGEDKEGAE